MPRWPSWWAVGPTTWRCSTIRPTRGTPLSTRSRWVRVSDVSEPTSRAAKRAATAQRILDAARAEFGERGLEATTIPRIAQRANVDPSLVMQHYGSKAALFAMAIQLDNVDPGE